MVNPVLTDGNIYDPRQTSLHSSMHMTPTEMYTSLNKSQPSPMHSVSGNNNQDMIVYYLQNISMKLDNIYFLLMFLIIMVLLAVLTRRS